MRYQGRKITAALLAGGTLLTGAVVGNAFAATSNQTDTTPTQQQRPQTEQGRQHRHNPAVKAAVQQLLNVTDAQMKASRVTGQSLTQFAASKNVSKADLVSTIANALKASKPANAPARTDAQVTKKATRIADHESGMRAQGPRGNRNNATHTAVRTAVASTLGITVRQLRTARMSGTTPAELATQKGVSKTDLVSAVVAALKANKPANAPTLMGAQLNDIASRIVDGIHR